MKVLFLGPNNSSLVEVLKKFGEEVIPWQEKIDPKVLSKYLPDFIVSFGYRHIVPNFVIEAFPRKIINLHISYLPWNRGADPNFWSFICDTPKGVSIHFMDNGLDTGALIAQKKIQFGPNETLKSTYEILQHEIVILFKQHWHEIRSTLCPSSPQKGGGTFHRAADKARLAHLTDPLGFDTKVIELENYAVEFQQTDEFWMRFSSLRD